MKTYFAYTALVLSVVGGCTGCSYINDKLGLEEDNFLEESAEALIEEHLGVDVDLSPDSEED